MSLKNEIAYIGLGSNLGDRQKNIEDAIALLKNTQGINVTARSSLYETKPVGLADQPDFINCVAEVRTELMPHALLKVCMDIEQQLLRKRMIKWGPRTIDLDILLYGSLQMEQPDLTIPHPLMHQRAFVLVPLSEIAWERIHPGFNASIGELYQRYLLANGESNDIIRREW